jgi:hypothetical protein
MSVAVIGCGRSGTNLVLEILSGNKNLKASKETENKKLFSGNKVYDDNYLTKCDTVYFGPKKLEKTLKKNPNMKIVWTIRDPRDMILSKIKRGQPKSKGGDGAERVADDATPKECIKDIEWMFSLYELASTKFSNRVMLLKMEDVIKDIEKEAKKICNFLNIPFDENMLSPMSRMRNKDKVKRYKKVDKNQISLWKNWESVYNGFFKDSPYPVEDMFNQVKHLIRHFKYEEADCYKSR